MSVLHLPVDIYIVEPTQFTLASNPPDPCFPTNTRPAPLGKRTWHHLCEPTGTDGMWERPPGDLQGHRRRRIYSWLDTQNEKNLPECQTCNISRSLEDNKIVDHSDMVGAVPVAKNRYLGVTGVTTKFHKCITELNYKLNKDNKRYKWQ